MKDENFKNTLNINEKEVWEAFEKVVKGFLGKKGLKTMFKIRMRILKNTKIP